MKWAASMLLLLAAASCGGSKSLTVEDAWARPAAAGATAAAYFVLRNPLPEDERLLSASSSIAAAVELHRTEVVDDRMRMRLQPDGVGIPAQGELAFAPGGYHVMLIDLEDALSVGQSFPLELEFQQSGRRQVTVEVRR